MKNYKRSERRHRAKHKFERRIKIWVQGINRFTDFAGNAILMDSKGGVERVKEEIRKGKAWKFLHHTSTPCSCKGMCAYLKYKRTPNHKAIKDAISEE